MTVVAIHQPNYLPWLGFFSKIAQADIFVLLDDAQFSKNSVINRVRIVGPAEPHWMTIPVTVRLGQRINQIYPASADWSARHVSLLYNTYRGSSHFKDVWPTIETLLNEVPAENLASINQRLIESIARKLGLAAEFRLSSSLGVPGQADDRLAAIVSRLAPGGAYLSGLGGANYQDSAKFEAAGLRLLYSRFEPKAYKQGVAVFQPGLSIIDALFHIGFPSTADAIRAEAA